MNSRDLQHVLAKIKVRRSALTQLISDPKNYSTIWPEEVENAWKQAAYQGWFVDWNIPFSSFVKAAESGNDRLNQYMCDYLDCNWVKHKNYLFKKCQQRLHILKIAFKLHEEGNYIACIPLFLSQADGITARYIKAFLFSEKEKRKTNIEIIKEKTTDIFQYAFLEVLSEDTQFSAAIASASNQKRNRGPNRNGILHGSLKHIDYGTEINSLKSITLLLLVVSCFEEPSCDK